MNKYDYSFEIAGQYRTGGDLYRIVLSYKNRINGEYGKFEIWASRESIDDKLGLSRTITQSDLIEFANGIFVERTDMAKDLDPYEGAFVTTRSISYGDYRNFPTTMPDPDQLIQTNISLSTSQHRWLKIQAATEGKSISEIIRTALEKYRESK